MYPNDEKELIHLLHIEYDIITYIAEEEDIGLVEEDIGLAEEIASHKPFCYYVMENGCVKEENTSSTHGEVTKKHLRLLFIWVKADGQVLIKF